MNKLLRAAYCIPCGVLKMAWTRLFHIRRFRGPLISLISPYTEITLEQGGELLISKGFKMRDGAKIRVRKGAKCLIGKNCSINSNNMIACRDYIRIGDNVQLSPNVQIYDHDHDYKAAGGISANKYKTSPIEIGNNVWVGANTIILRGSKVGNNCVIGSGSIIKGKYPDNSVIVQRRKTEISLIE